MAICRSSRPRCHTATHDPHRAASNSFVKSNAALATVCLQQGQLKAALEQIDTGRTEANRAHDKRVLLLVHARVKLANGELPAAADALKLWLEDASSATAADAVTVGGASMQYAGAMLALSAAFGGVGGRRGRCQDHRLSAPR